jgi:hypothetical protein
MHEFLQLFTYSLIDRVLFFLSYHLCSHQTLGLIQLEPWLLQVVFSAFLSCAVIIAACMNPASLRSNLWRDKNNNQKTLTRKPRIIPKELHACKSLIVALSDGWSQSHLRRSCARKRQGHGLIDQRRICCTITANHCTASCNWYVPSTT